MNLHLYFLVLFSLFSLAHAQWQRCDRFWPKLTSKDPGRKWTVKTDCHALSGYPKEFGKTKVHVIYTRKWSKLSSKTKDAVKPVLEESLAETFKVYDAFAKLPTEIVIILTTVADGDATAETSNPYEKRSPFQIKLLQRWTTEASTNTPRALQGLAHELYHCVQGLEFGNHIDPEYIREGSANYFSNIAFPDANFEWPGKDYSGAEYDPSLPLYAHVGRAAYATSIFFQSMGHSRDLHSLNNWVLSSQPGSHGVEERGRLSGLTGIADEFFTFAQDFSLQSIEDTSGVLIPTIPEITPVHASIKLDAAGTTGTATLKTAPFTISVYKISVKAGQTAKISSSANHHQRLAYRKPEDKDWTKMSSDAGSAKPIDLPCKDKDTTYLVLFISTANVKSDKVKITVKSSRKKQCHGRSGFIHYPLFNEKTSGGYCPKGTHMADIAIWCCPDGLELDHAVAAQVSLCCPPGEDCYSEIIPDNMRCADPSWTLWNKDDREVGCCMKGYYPNGARYCVKDFDERDPRFVEMPQDN
ncbi:hypothetical protein AK830_g4049 [Neonectria ditissima]|uniref:Uncharacterized protein n=1 Tax=Neonectria ditissima TaxID=78410 RepID=A0A0P7BGV4_9HYPO|nr:hypothetical protein AK830_g4049 [Neonectria ditissima]